MTLRYPILLVAVIVGLSSACERKTDVGALAPGTEVTVKQQDGGTVSGTVVEVNSEEMTVAAPAGERKTVKRSQIARVDVTSPAPDTGSSAAAPAPPVPQWREVTIPEGTVLSVRLDTPVASDTSTVEQTVRGTLRDAIEVDGVTAIASGSEITGTVTEVARAGKVKGRAHLALRFDSLAANDERYDIRTSPVSRTAATTKKKDATKIGIGAGAGAVIGAIVGGGKGAAIGATTGGGAGTAVVMATRGDEVRIAGGTTLSVRLVEPLRVRVRI